MSRRPGLAARLLTAQFLVVAAGAVTFALVALAVGPALFRSHVRQALGAVSPVLTRHLNDAFAAGASIAIGVGSGAALLTAAAVSLLVTRRLSQPIHGLAAAAAAVAAGDYAARVPDAALGPEIDALTGAFNTMAARLEATETTRRRLLADVAHELRTPLATLEGFLEGLADGVRPPTRETWDVMAAQTTRLRRLSDDISLVSDVEEHRLPLRLAAISLSDVVAAAASAARPAYDAKGVSLTSQLPDDLPEVEADEDRIAQVLDGLLANALRHTSPGGHVTLTGQQAGGAAHVVIADTGEGIAPEHLPHIFERFYRADPARDRAHGGSGIGLTIARALVAEHGGTLAAASEGAGTGARFTVSLPAATSPGKRGGRL